MHLDRQIGATLPFCQMLGRHGKYCMQKESGGLDSVCIHSKWIVAAILTQWHNAEILII
jgi:hypothetical protein